jgi:hypothetical protein
MSSMSWLFSNLPAGRNTATEFFKAHREQLAFEAEERARQRLAQLTEQRSTLNPPDARIRVWEKVHELRLPLDPAHAIVAVVAADTGLTLSEVRHEQRARSTTATVSAEPQS